jgi:hypothetical protein
VNEQTERFANTSAATNEAEIADREMVDHTADDGRRSPGLSPILHIASPSDWSALFSDMGLVSMIPSNLEVDLIIPRHERKRISLPNDAALIDSFLNGLQQRRFSFYGSNNRPVLKEDVHRWHGTNPLDILQARLTEESVQEYTTSEENRLKRRRKGVAETLDEIAAWVEQQRVRMSTDTTRFAWNIQEEEEEL